MTQQKESTDGATISLALKWAESDLPAIVHADHMLLSYRGDYFVLTIGQAEDPLVHPKDTERIRQLQEQGEVGILPLARFAVPRTRMVEWAVLISDLVKRFEQEGASGAESD